MKGKIQSSKNRKTIALVATIVVLLAGTVTGVSLFLKDDGSASATGFENDIVQPSENNPTEQNPEQVPGEEQGEQENGESENSGTVNTEGQNGQTSAVPGITQGTQGTTGTQQLPEESISYQDRLVAEDFLVGWTPIGISAITDTMGKYINSPKLQIEKVSYTETDLFVNGEMELPEEIKYTAIQPGEMVIYEIRVSNFGNTVAKDIKVLDKIPEEITVVQIGANGIEKDGNVQWISDIPAQTQVSFKFAAIVNENAEGNIKNTAIVNGDKTNETENAVIETEKTAVVTRDGKLVTEEARPGDVITYTITVTNTANVKTTTKVTDLLPVNTILVEESITENGKLENGIITWEEVTIEANQKAELEFSVRINQDANSVIENIATVGITDTNKVENNVSNITATKIVDKKEAKVGETLTYKITLSNSGNVAGKVTVSDAIPEGTTIKDATIEGYNAKTNTMTWSDVEVKAGENVELTLEVVINKDTIESVVNTATLDGEKIPETPETKVANITGTKTVDKKEAKVGETLTYTITLVNNGNTSGKVTVSDAIPEGTTIKDETTEGYEVKTNTMIWSDVEVGAGETVELTLEVVINETTTTSVVNTAVLDGEKIPETPETKVANITAIKASEVENPLKEMGTIKYTISLNNSGNVAGKVTVKDVVPEGTTLVADSIKVDGKNANNIVVENEKITWLDIEVLEGKEVVLSFEVTVNVFEGETITVRNDKATIDGKEVNTTEDEAEKAYVEIEASKVWEDNENVAKKRPESIILIVKNDAGEVARQEVNADMDWKYTFERLPKYDSEGNEIEYTIDEEINSIFYEKNVEGNVVTNTFKVPDTKISIKASKVWNDDDDRAGKRPESVILIVKNATKEVIRQEVNENINWEYEFTDLPKYDELGNEIEYTIDEEIDSIFYEKDVEGNVVTNTFKVPDTKISVPVEKVWNDNSNSAGKRPTSISLQLKANDLAEGQAVVLSGEGNVWNYTFENLAKYDANGDEISYTVEETVDSIFYVPEVTGDMTKYTITNTFEVPDTKVSVPVEKVWDDNDDRAGKRPTSISVQLKANNVAQGQAVVLSGEGNVWNYTFENLAKYDANGDEIEYTVEETVDSIFYVPEVTGDMTKYTITNTFEVPDTTIDIPVEKVWNDNQNEAQKRPDTIKVQLIVANETSREVVIGSTTEYGWNYTFTGLPKYDVNGDIINYGVREVEVNENDLYFYNTVITGDMTKYTITNEFTVPGEEINVLAEKVWVDTEEQQDKRPTAITLIVKTANGEVDRYTVTENDEWKHEFTLPKYDRLGNEIVYTVDEEEVSQGDLYFYTKNIEGYTVTNTFTVPNETVNVTINKVWVDTEAQQNKRPDSITLQVKNGNTVIKSQEVSADMGWSYTFQDLPKYDANGNVITYTAGEVIDSKFYTRTDNGTTTTVTNTFTVPDEKVSVPVEKVWDDNSNSAGKRPTSISVQLKANNVAEGQAVVLSGEGNVWNYTFENLAKYDANGDEISYTVEETVDSIFYVTEVTGNMDKYTITNTFEVPDEMVDVTINKVWVDTQAQQDKRPTSITLQVKDGNTVVDSQEVTANISWKYKFTDLPKYDENGDEITYTAGEVINSKFYTPSAEGTTVTNTFTVPNETVDITINKVWVDTQAQQDKRPTSITLQVKDGNTVVDTIERTAETGWSYTFKDLPKYDENGDEITYTAGEVIDSKFYTRTDDGTTTTVTNTFAVPNEKTKVTVTKVWEDEGNTSARPNSIKVMVEGTEKETVLSGSKTDKNWSYEFTDLPKYDANGDEITYTVNEEEINVGDLENYSKNISGTTITNTYMPPVLTVAKSSTTASPVRAGDTISYQIKVDNTGAGIARNVVIRDTLDLTKVEFVEASDGGVLNGNEVTWTIGTLSANTGTKIVTLTVRVKNTAKLGTEIINTAIVDDGTTTSEPVKHKVETNVTSLEKSDSITGTNMVIVLDLSSSMNNKITNTQTRLDAAKDAAEAFINKLFPQGVTTGNQLSVVTFNYKNSSDQDAYNTEVQTNSKYKGTKVFTFTSSNTSKTIATTKVEAADLIDDINDIELGTNLGTNIAAALETTKTQVNALKALKPANRNVVIFLGDGAPSPYRKDGEWRSKYAGNVESNIVSLALQIKAIQNVPASRDITPVNTIIHTIGFGVTSTTDENYTQCCTDASKHSSHEHIYNGGMFGRTYVQDSYGYYYVEESDSTIATRILQRMSSGTGCYHLSDNGAGLLQNFNTIYVDTATVTGSTSTNNGVITKVLATQLDTTKSVILTVNGVDKEVSYSNFAANGLTYTEVGTTYTLSWDVSQYDANTTLKITYNTK